MTLRTNARTTTAWRTPCGASRVTNRLCQGVLASLLVAATGCYDMHGMGSDAGAPLDANARLVPADGAWRPGDASWPRPGDAGQDVLTIPPRCPAVRADATCLESFALAAYEPFVLPFQFDGCGCCIETECEVRADEATRTLSLTTHLCPDTCDCDACITPTGGCSVPALTELGQWTVEVNGTVAFAIGVVDLSDPIHSPPPPGCATYAELDECGGATPDLTTGPARGAVCVARSSRGDTRQVLSITNGCWSCGQLDSSCTAIVNPRLTDDLPPGGDIQLTARTFWTDCDVDCPGVCIAHVRECDLPPLVPGDFYRVFVDGEVVQSFVEGEPLAPCPTR